MYKSYQDELKLRARALRRCATKYERHLWYDFLSQFPHRFNRQKVIGNYIVDFYCHDAKLAIELDGSQHYDNYGKDYDKKRTENLGKYGIKVIRFSNLDIERNFAGVCETIDLTVKKRVGTPQKP